LLAQINEYGDEKRGCYFKRKKYHAIKTQEFLTKDKVVKIRIL